MSTRKGFLTAAASTALIAAAPAPSPSPPAAARSAAPSPRPSAKPSELSMNFAQRMRKFDSNLTDKDIEAIAAGIDDNLKLGEYVNPKGRVLKNWDEPDSIFEVGA
jgi:hypothetical protein